MDTYDQACSHAGDCPMFGLFQRSGTLGLWKLTYCEGDYTKCARYERGLQGRSVPATLLPNGRELPQLPQ